MMKTSNKLSRLLGLAGKAFILASAVAVILPMPQYASSLSDAEDIVWLARLLWMLMLTFGVGVVLLLAGFLARKLQILRRKGKNENI
jgi:heme/copper-type cytochrome/quinol oxidase subunit 2